MDLGLQGKYAIVTGGSRGIGKAIARELAREGVDVAIVARNKDALDSAARDLGAGTNRRILPFAADMTNTEQVDRMVAEAARQLERTPGLLAARARQLDVSPEEAERQDFAPDSPRGNAICRMVDASEIAFVTAFLASDKAWAVSGELVAATGGAGRAVYF